MFAPYNRRKRAPLRPNPAVSELMAGEYADRPLGGWHGETLPTPAPPPPAPEPFVIPPPPWAGEIATGAALDPPQQPARPDALAELKRQNGDEKWPEWGPPAPPLPPLERPTFPKPDWEAEEKQRLEHEQRLERDRRAALVEEWLAEDSERYPAKPRKGAA